MNPLRDNNFLIASFFEFFLPNNSSIPHYFPQKIYCHRTLPPSVKPKDDCSALPLVHLCNAEQYGHVSKDHCFP